MKKILFAIALLCLNLPTLSSARQPIGALRGELSEWRIDENDKSLKNVVSVGIEINIIKKVIVLKVQQRKICPPGELCTAVLPSAKTFEVPLVDRQLDKSCKVAYYTGEKDLRVFGGSKLTIKVADRKSFSCGPLPRNEETYVTFEKELFQTAPGSSISKLTSYFRGSALNSYRQ